MPEDMPVDINTLRSEALFFAYEKRRSNVYDVFFVMRISSF